LFFSIAEEGRVNVTNIQRNFSQLVYDQSVT